MHRKFSLPIIAVMFVAVLASYTFCQRPQSVNKGILLQLVSSALEYAHYSTPRLDDEFSSNMFDAYLKMMDYSKQFYTEEDITKLEVYRNKLDNEIASNKFEFFDLALSIYKTRLEMVKGFYKEILSNPIDLYTDNYVETDYDKVGYVKDEDALKELWKNLSSYQVMTRVHDSLSQQAKKDSSEQKSIEELEKEAREKVEKLYSDYFKRLDQRNDDDYMALYINALTSVFDPHTQYLPPSDKASFDISMSGQFEGIGATLQESEGYVKVVELMPGSPSWMSGKIKVNDLILKVRQGGETESMDVYGMRLDDVVKKIRGEKGSQVILNIKHVDGSIEDITLTRDIIIIEETYAKSAIVKDSNTGKRMGYIDLPKFYANFERTETGRSSAEDVAKELEKLKNEKVEGVILDLRNNGGGSLPDAVNMSGLFIPKGPMVQVSQRNGRKQVLSDTDPQVHYDGNLVILVNPSSASASEILAAAMQDYNRAIIMGSNTTFGKGTVQTVIDLNDVLRDSSSAKGKVGSLIVTIQKFFRINGGSTQLKGVRPDIVMPDPYTEMEIGERNEDFPLPWTEIDPAKYTIEDNDFSEAIRLSKARMDTNKHFDLIREQVEVLRNQREDTKIPLNLNAYTQRDSIRKEQSKRLESLDALQTSIRANILSVDALPADADTVKIGRNARWLSTLEKDVYIEEAVRVLESM